VLGTEKYNISWFKSSALCKQFIKDNFFILEFLRDADKSGRYIGSHGRLTNENEVNVFK
jgi:hypothetical protein